MPFSCLWEVYLAMAVLTLSRWTQAPTVERCLLRGVAGATSTCEFVHTSIKNKTSLIEFSVLLAIGHYRIEYQSECR
jgi:hypothetical protein